jgi:hypothetical protein
MPPVSPVSNGPARPDYPDNALDKMLNMEVGLIGRNRGPNGSGAI